MIASTGVRDLLASHLLTDEVLDLVLGADITVEDDTLEWRSWPQTFGSTAGPWRGVGAAAMTTFQVTVAVVKPGEFLVFVGSDLLAYGTCDNDWFHSQVHASNINTRALATYGLTVLERPLSNRRTPPTGAP